MPENILFSGTPYDSCGVYGGISNQQELVKVCPEEFKNTDNAWRKFAQMVCSHGARCKDWKWKFGKESVEKIPWLTTLIKNTGGLSDEEVLDLAAWMLSEMLSEIPPDFIPAPPSEPSGRPYPKI